MKNLPFEKLPDPFLIAEVGGNHEGDYDYACQLAKEAVESGAHAVKYQAYAPDRIVNRVLSPDRNKHFSRFALSEKQYQALADFVTGLGAEFMASLWDQEFVDLLDPYISIHKIGSGDLTNFPLVKKLALTGKPLCASTAMSTIEEVLGFIDFVDKVNPDLRRSGRLCLMHCVAMYGEPLDQYANLSVITTLKEKLPADIVIGYSDHTRGTVAAKVSICMGARIVEVHFTNDKSREFRDHQLSKTRDEIKELLEFSSRYHEMLGSGVKEPVPHIETPERIREFRRAVYFSEDVPAGTLVTEANITTLRPCDGIDARAYYSILGQKLAVDKKALDPISWNDFEKKQSTE